MLRPFVIGIYQDSLEDLDLRLRRTRLPSEISERVGKDGPSVALMRQLAAYCSNRPLAVAGALSPTTITPYRAAEIGRVWCAYVSKSGRRRGPLNALLLSADRPTAFSISAMTPGSLPFARVARKTSSIFMTSKAFSIAASLAMVLATGLPALADTDSGPVGVTGSAVLIAPNAASYAGVVLQHCEGKSATLRVILPAQRLLESTEFLAVHVEYFKHAAVQVDGNNEAPEIVGFQGHSTLGCLPAGTHITLVHSPGGLLQNLWLVLGVGTITGATKVGEAKAR